MTDREARQWFTAKAAKYGQYASDARRRFLALALSGAITGTVAVGCGVVCVNSESSLPFALAVVFWAIAPFSFCLAWNSYRNAKRFSQEWLQLREDALDSAKALRS